MKPEDIRKLYRQETPATVEEARAAAEECCADPEQARRLLKTLYSLSVEDRDFAFLLHLFLEGMLMRQIEERAADDDEYALACAVLITGLMEGLKPPQRGRPKPARSA